MAILDNFYKLYETLRARKSFSYLKYLKKTQWYTLNQLKDIQWEAFKSLLHHAYKNVPYYQKLFCQLSIHPKDINTFDDYRKLPILNKEIIKQNYPDLIAENYKNRLLLKSTGGTMGVPLKFGYTRESYEWRRATFFRGYGWTGYKEGKKVAYLWSIPLTDYLLKNRIKDGLYRFFLRQKYFNVFELTPEKMALYYKKMKQFKPRHIVAYAVQMYFFARFVKEKGYIIWPLESIILGAEKITISEKEFIQDVFQCPIFETYGCREFMLIASECEKHHGMHINMENLIVEVIKRDGESAEPGETGQIIVTDLHNYAMPFIRYKNEDIVKVGAKCSCGRGLEVIKEVEGRELDVIKLPNGRILSGVFFPHLLKDFEEVEKFQFIQHDYDKFTLKLVLNSEFKHPHLEEIKQIIKQFIGQASILNIEVVDEIPLTSSGKFRVTISYIPYE